MKNPRKIHTDKREASQKAQESLRRKLLKPDADGMVRISAADLWRLPPGKTDWAKVDALTDDDIARAVAGDPDAAPLDADWSRAKLYFPKLKQPMSRKTGK